MCGFIFEMLHYLILTHSVSNFHIFFVAVFVPHIGYDRAYPTYNKIYVFELYWIAISQRQRQLAVFFIMIAFGLDHAGRPYIYLQFQYFTGCCQLDNGLHEVVI